MKQLPDVEFEVKWLPYMLRPQTPIEGVAKAPDTPDNRRVGARLKAVGQAAGIDFTGKTDRTPNTLLAHTMLKYAESEGAERQNALAEVLFRHYFTDGRFPDLENVRAAAVEAGLDAQKATAFATSKDNQQETLTAALSWQRRGVRGVPMFFANDEPLFSGAQPPDAFVRAFQDLD